MGAGRNSQLSLLVEGTPVSHSARTVGPRLPRRPSLQIDQLLHTEDVVRITGRHRCTIYRWVQAGAFPPKHGGGGRGWLRSDVELWLNGPRNGRDDI